MVALKEAQEPANIKNPSGADEDRDELIRILKGYFEEKSDRFPIDLAFLYGSWAAGLPRRDSDVDLAFIFHPDIGKNEIFEIMTTISLELTDILKKDINVIYIDSDSQNPCCITTLSCTEFPY